LGDNLIVRAVLTVVFAAMALHYLRRLVGRCDVAGRVSHTARIAMCLAMLCMAGLWQPSLPTQPGVSLFLAAALWFGYLALFSPAQGVDTDPHRQAHQHPWFDAAKMLAMAWMYVAMSPTATRPAGGDGAMPAMAGMPGMAGIPGGPSAVSVPTWSERGSLAVAGVLVAGLLWQSRGALARVRAVGLDDAVAAGMAAAMAGSILLLL
jgi:hypothetical protein